MQTNFWIFQQNVTILPIAEIASSEPSVHRDNRTVWKQNKPGN